MVDFQKQIATALKGRGVNENVKTISEKLSREIAGPFWFYHVYFIISGKDSVKILPRKVAIKEYNEPDGTSIPPGHFGTIAVDQQGKFGFVVCSKKDNFSRKEGRKRAADNLLIAQINKSGIWKFGPKNFYGGQPVRLISQKEDILRDAVAEALANFLTYGIEKRS